MSENSKITQTPIPHKDMMALALLFTPGVDYVVMGSARHPQILMDLSSDEMAFAKAALAMFRSAIDQASEEQLAELLQLKIGVQGDPISQLFGRMG